jgi:hypothetical protein
VGPRTASRETPGAALILHTKGPFPSISTSLSPFGCLPSRIASTIRSNLNALLADGTDWRFLNQLKRELKT